MRRGFPNIYLDQTVPAHLQNQVSGYLCFAAACVAIKIGRACMNRKRKYHDAMTMLR